MKTFVYSSLILLSSVALVAANPASAAPICVLGGAQCVDTIPATQCFVTLTGLVNTGVGCNGGTLTVICAVQNVGCFSINTPGCVLMVGVFQHQMFCVI